MLHAAAMMLFAAFCPSVYGDKRLDLVEVAAEMEAMGTIVSITTYAPTAVEGQIAVQLAEAEIRRLENLWSATDPKSEISALNSKAEIRRLGKLRSATDPKSEISALNSNSGSVTVSNETAMLLRFAKKMAGETGGAFDPTVYPLVNAWGFLTQEYRIPSDEEIAVLLSRVGSDKMLITGNAVTLLGGAQIDLAGIAKGAAGDSVLKVLQKSGIKSAIVNIGGSVHLAGARPDGRPWRIGIRDPRSRGILGVLTVQDCAVVTSGIYERNFTADGHLYHHIMNPETGRPAESGLLSVTIIAHEGMLADALSTGLFVMGLEKAADFWREYSERQIGGFEIVLVTSENTVLVSEGIAEVFTPEYAYSADVRIITKDPEYTPLLSDYIGRGGLN